MMVMKAAKLFMRLSVGCTGRTYYLVDMLVGCTGRTYYVPVTCTYMYMLHVHVVARVVVETAAAAKLVV